MVDGIAEDIVKLLKEISEYLRNLRDIGIMTFIGETFTHSRFVTDWCVSSYYVINTGEILPGDSVSYQIQPPQGYCIAGEKISWKLAEWWTSDITWERGGVTILYEPDTVDGESEQTLVSEINPSVFTIKNNSTTNSQQAIIRWSYIIALQSYYETVMGHLMSELTKILNEMGGKS